MGPTASIPSVWSCPELSLFCRIENLGGPQHLRLPNWGTGSRIQDLPQGFSNPSAPLSGARIPSVAVPPLPAHPHPGRPFCPRITLSLESSAPEAAKIDFLVASHTGPGPFLEAHMPGWWPSLGDSSSGSAGGVSPHPGPPIPSAIPLAVTEQGWDLQAREQFCILLPLRLSGVISLIALLYFGVRDARCIWLISYRGLYSSS